MKCNCNICYKCNAVETVWGVRNINENKICLILFQTHQSLEYHKVENQQWVRRGSLTLDFDLDLDIINIKLNEKHKLSSRSLAVFTQTHTNSRTYLCIGIKLLLYYILECINIGELLLYMC